MSDSNDFEVRLTKIEEKIQAIEGKLNIKTAPYDEEASIECLQTKVNESKDSSSFSGRGLGYIAGLCFVLAASFTIKMAIDSGWLTPLRQVVMSGVLGVLLIYAGFIIKKIDEKYSSFLPGIGIGILYLSIFGGHVYYQMISLPITIMFIAMISFLSIYLVKYYQYNFFLLASLIGAYCAPLLLAKNNINLYIIGFYFIIWSITYSILSAKLKNRTLHSICCYVGLGVFSIIYIFYKSYNAYNFITLQFIQFIIFAFGIVYHSIINQDPLKNKEIIYYLPILIFFYTTEYVVLDTIIPELTPWIALSFAFLIIALQRIGASKISKDLTASKNVTWSFAALVFVQAGYFTLVPSKFCPWVLFAIVSLMAYFINSKFVKQVVNIKFIPALLILVFGFEYVQALILVIEFKDWHLISEILVSFGFSIILMMVFQINKKRNEIKNREISLIILVFAHLQSVCAIYSIFNSMGSLAVSASWSLYAILILLFAFWKKDSYLGHSSVFVMIIAALKVLLYDVSDSEPVIRIICLLLTGILLYVGGLLLRIISKWSKNKDV